MNATGTASDSTATSALSELPPLSRRNKYLMLLVQLGLVLGVVHLFDVEGKRQLFPILGLISGAVAIHAWLPMHFRLRFFAILSVGTVVFVLGFKSGAAVVGIAGLLIAICYLPLDFRLRLLLLASVSAGLVWLRYDDMSPVWVVVGSMFMFRLAIFLFDCRREPATSPLATAVSYFFMMPNVSFPFFPVVDYRKFRHSHYNDDEWAIYQRGMGWILRGIVHLLLYRFIRMSLVPEPYEIRDVLSVSIYLATNYALYIEVSGQFHLMTGLLHLFGFNLPRTHDNYFLASSPSDIWRRINIYWKDFLQRLVFSPSMYLLKRWGIRNEGAIVCGVMAAFVSTWLLHSWQAYWLLGKFPIRASDATLWVGVGAVVAVSSLSEYRRRMRPGLPKHRTAWLSDLGLSLRVVGMFILVSLFWACWTNPLFPKMVGRLLTATPGSSKGLETVLLCVLGLVLGGTVFLRLRRAVLSNKPPLTSLTDRHIFALQSLALAALIVIGLPGFGRLLGKRTSLALQDFRSDIYVHPDPFTQLQSYYEDLESVTVQGGPLLTALNSSNVQRRHAGPEFSEMTRRSDPILEMELIPNWSGILDNASITINQYGMRDRRTIALDKPSNTTRIALVGSSVVMGYGVADDEVFSRLLETRLNREPPKTATRYEVLNFGTGRQWALHRRVLIDRKVLAFDPDALFYFAHQDEQEGPLRHLTQLVSDGTPLPYEFLDQVVEEAGVSSGTPPGVILRRLRAQMMPILEGIYRSTVEVCRRRGIVPVYIYLPLPAVPNAPDLSRELLPMAKRAGFVVVDMTDWHKGHKSEDLKPRRDDSHLDAQGHRVLAVKLFEALLNQPDALPNRARGTVEAQR